MAGSSTTEINYRLCAEQEGLHRRYIFQVWLEDQRYAINIWLLHIDETQRPETLRDTEAAIMREVRRYVKIEPGLLPVENPAVLKPAVFSTSGGTGKEADRLLRRMAERMSIKRGENYSSVVSFLRRRFRFDLLKTCVIAMRGYKKPTTTAAKFDTLDLDLRTTASSC